MKKDIATPTRTREIMKKYKLKPYKGLGQNFLIDQNIIGKIIEAGKLEGDDSVIEIGPGIGSLTQAILGRITTGKLFAVEKDKRLVEILEDLFAGEKCLEILNQDILDIEWTDFVQKWDIGESTIKVIANLPYYITTPIIMNLLESGFKFSRLVFMVQKEVAERMVAPPGGKDYGSLSVAVQYYAKAEIVHQVPPTVFIPRPEVYSSIICLTPYLESPVKVQNIDFFFQIVKAIFQQRRKNIKNGLSKAASLNLERNLVVDGLHRAGIDPRIRGEKLSIEMMANLSNILWQEYN